jgi:hypothetical protein
MSSNRKDDHMREINTPAEPAGAAESNARVLEANSIKGKRPEDWTAPAKQGPEAPPDEKGKRP